MKNKYAKKEDWKIEYMPEQNIEVKIDLQYNPDEFNKISYGLIPEEMEDKWFMYMENNILHIHRSWTGFCIYKLKFERANDIYKTKNLTVNRNENEYKNTDSKYDVKLACFLIDNLLLGKNTPFPLPEDLSEDIPKGVYQHHISGTGYKEEVYKNND